MRRIRRAFVTLVALAVVVSMTMVIPAGAAQTSKDEVQVYDYELAVCNIDHAGEIEEIKMVDWLALKGNGSMDFRQKTEFEDLGRFQGVRGFSGPTVEGDELVWKGLSVDGNKNVLASTDLSEANVKVASERIPLKIEFTYEWDGKRVKDIEEYTGKSGHFKLSCKMTNVSKEMTTLEYQDPDTGEMKTEKVETYLPLVILPYDWVWDNTVYYNLETDPTGVTFWMPDAYNTGWSIPLFPPATTDNHTITVEADVKNFKLPPLTFVVSCVFPHTNQTDTLPTFKAGLMQLYDGVKQLNAGLGDAVKGVGDPGTSDTLLYGITAIDGGLKQMADAAEGVPYAKANIDSKMIPGVQQAAAGIGSETTPNTLLYADAAVTGGLQGIASGIGSPTTENTLLYAIAAMGAGLEDIKAGIGSATTDTTLLYAISKMQGGLNDIKSSIGNASQMHTLVWGVAQVVSGIDAIVTKINYVDPNPPYTHAGLLQALSMMLTGVNAMINGINTQLLPGLAKIRAGVSSGDYAHPGILEGLTNPSGVPQPGILEGLASIQANTLPPIGMDPGGPIYAALGNIISIVDTLDPLGTNLQLQQIKGTASALQNQICVNPYPNSIYAAATAMITGVNAMINGITAIDPNPPYANAGLLQGLDLLKWGIDNTTAPPGSPSGLLQGLQSIQAGLQGIQQAIVYVSPDPTNPATPPGLLQALGLMRAGLTSNGDYDHPGVKEGLELISGGIGEPDIENTLLYAATAVQGGLLQIAAGIGSAETTDTLLYAVQAVENGLNQMLAGIGGQQVPDTLLYAMAAMQMGLQQMKAGMSTGDPNNPGLLEGLVILSAGLGDIVKGLGSAESPDTLLYGTSQITSGLTQLGEGLTKATAEGTQVMLEGLYDNISYLSMTQSQIEATAKRGEEFNHLLGVSDEAEDSQVRFVFQAPATYNYTSGSKASWIVAIIISLVILLLLAGGGIMLSRRTTA